MNRHTQDTLFGDFPHEDEHTEVSEAGEPDTVVEPEGTSPDATDSAQEPPEDAAQTFLADPGQHAVDAFFGPPRLDRERPARPPLVPRWLIIAAGCLLGVGVLALGIGLWSSQQASIPTPKLVGVDYGVAKTRLAEKGLRITVTERRFSSSSRDTVLSQQPTPGTKLRSGDAVTVVVSAGTEQFSMPNVVGDGLLLARGVLGTKGLDVRVQAQPSQQPSDTVLASSPAAGQVVHTGDIVLLTVAAPGPDSAVLLPYDMTGVTVCIDPAPANDALSDVPLDVARRLRSLVEASHGKVVTTRALADTSTLEAEPARAQKAAATSSTVAIGFSTVPVGGAGLIVYSPSPILPHASASAKLCSRVASDLASGVGTVHVGTLTTDTVMVASGAPWCRVQLGALSQREDVAKFSDTAWEDSVARSMYKAIAAVYGHKTQGSP
jgi:N-acetylmuramoyl-L-alanine amidase